MTLNRTVWNCWKVLPILAACWAGLFASALRTADEPGGTAPWYKGSTHAHSLWSDGDEFPEMVADWYKTHGYDFLALSDHNVLMAGERWRNVAAGKNPVPSAVVKKCQNRFGAEWLVVRGDGKTKQVKLKTLDEIREKLTEPDKFLLIQNEEVTSQYANCEVHLNAMNLAELIPPQRGRSVTDTLANNLDAVARQSRRLGRPMLAHVNHPNWSDYDVSPEDLAAASAAKFVEVCNASPENGHYGDATHPSIEKLWDVANTIRIAKMKAAPLFGVASDDAHNYQKFAPDQANPGRGWITVRAKHLDAGALLEAMNRGDFYASTGVILRDVAYDATQRSIAVNVQSEPGVHYTIEFIGTLAGADPTAKPATTGKKSKRPGRTYSPEVGKVLSSVAGDAATYRFTGNELYVRAVVRSDKPIPNAPADCVQTQEAWCQPMGWERK